MRQPNHLVMVVNNNKKIYEVNDHFEVLYLRRSDLGNVYHNPTVRWEIVRDHERWRRLHHYRHGTSRSWKKNA